MHAFTAGNLASAALVSTRLERTLRNAKTPADVRAAMRQARTILRLLERAVDIEKLNKEGPTP